MANPGYKRKVRYATEFTEPFRTALMKEHANDWDMQTVAEAAYICGEVVQKQIEVWQYALEKGENPFKKPGA